MQNTLHNELKKIIDSRQMSASEIARRAGCSRQYLYSVVNLGHQPTLPQAAKLASAIGFSLEFRRVSKKLAKSKQDSVKTN
jgi:DNA-binding phage protein